MSNLYNSRFYEEMKDRNTKTAREIMPVLIERLSPASIVDVGCGQGIFLEDAEKNGIKVLGIDGDYVERDKLLIHNFMPHDLTKPLYISDEKYDLACSFEVAEHLPEKDADTFVETLVNLSDIIVFSAAIPEQGGVGHINEKWSSYWCEKFEERGYIVSDCLKKIFWDNQKIAPLRRQNILLFVKSEKYSEVIGKFETDQVIVDVVHPDIYSGLCSEIHYLCKKNSELEKKSRCFEAAMRYLSEEAKKDLFASLSSGFVEDTFWELVDQVELLENFCEAENGTVVGLECKELNGLEERLQTDSYIVWGAGKDGNKVVRLLNMLGKKQDAWVDSNMEREGVISPQEFLEIYAGQIVVVASRKFGSEIKRDLELKLCDLKNTIFLGEL